MRNYSVMEAAPPQITQHLIDALTINQYTRWMRELRRLPPEFLPRLQFARRHLPAELAAQVVTQWERRERAARKFARAERMFFTAEGLEQATGEMIAAYRASRFPVDVPVFDACCGVGGDALALAVRGPVLAVDAHFETALCARANVRACLPPEAPPVSVLCADATRFDLARLARAGFSAAFFDPSRRGGRQNQDRHRVRSADEYAPPLDFADELRRHFPCVAVKVSPAIDDETLACYPDARIEFVSQGGECKECLLWFDPQTRPDQPPTPYSAVVLRPDSPPAILRSSDCEPLLTDAPRAWLIEPDPAVIRAHLLPQIGAEFDAALLDRRFAYLTADRFAPTPFAVGYPVLEALPYHPKNVQARLLALKRRVTAIKKRGVEIDPAALRKRLPGDQSSADAAVLVLARQGEKILALICAPPLSAAVGPPATRSGTER